MGNRCSIEIEDVFLHDRRPGWGQYMGSLVDDENDISISMDAPLGLDRPENADALLGWMIHAGLEETGIDLLAEYWKDGFTIGDAFYRPSRSMDDLHAQARATEEQWMLAKALPAATAASSKGPRI